MFGPYDLIPDTTLQLQINNHIETITTLQGKDDIENIIQKRTKATAAHCTNPYSTDKHRKYERLNISQLPNNWIYFANRCQMNKKHFIKNHHGDFDTLWMNSEIGYLHNYKCGGSTVQFALNQLKKIDLKGDYLYNDSRRSYVNLFVSSHRFMNESGWNANPEKWYRMLSDMFLFTFVRDPIDRFLSSFYEVHTRNYAGDRIWSSLRVSQYSGINRLRKLLEFFKQNINDYMFDASASDEISTVKLWRGENHFHPQMLFLWNSKFSFLPFDYIGELNNVDDAMKMIMDEFSDYYHENPLSYETFVKHIRARGETSQGIRTRKTYMNATEKSYFITRDQLSDTDIQMLCEIYWVDYICMPFDIPKQCDIQRLLKKYYDRFVTYNDCYFS